MNRYSSESIKSNQLLMQKLNNLYMRRDSTDFLKELNLLKSLDIKNAFLNTIKLINALSKTHSISEYCDKPLYLNLNIKENVTVLDFLCAHSEEGNILKALKNNKNHTNKNIWPEAIKENYIKVIKWLIKNDVQYINTPCENGFTPGALAVLMGRKNIVSMLREVGAYFNYVTNEKGYTLWHRAVIEKNEQLTDSCIDCRLPINTPDQEGYTAAYYLVMNSQGKINPKLKKLPGFKSALVSDAFNSILKNNLSGLNAILNAKEISASSKNEQGYTLLDIACIMGTDKIIKALRKHNANLSLYGINNLDSQKSYLNQLKELQDKYVINIDTDDNCIKINLTHLSAKGQLLSSIKFNPWIKNAEKAKNAGKWKVFAKDDNTCYVLITKSETTTEPDLFCEVSSNGELKLQYANLPGATLQLSTEGDFVFDSVASVKNLDVQANEILFTENSKTFNGHALKLTAKQIDLQGSHTFAETEINSAKDFIQNGDFVSELFSLKANSATVAGQLMIPNKASIDTTLNFTCEGSIVFGKSGNIKAHVLTIAKQAQILVQQGELKAHGTAKLENSGAIIGDQLFLSSGLMLTNNHGGLIKGLSCVLTAPQTNQGGFLLAGQKSTLSYIDWGLSFAHAGIKIAEVGAYITNPTAISLKGYLLAAKTLNRAADILYRSTVKGEEINHSEIVTLIIENVIPFIGNISSHEEQAKVLVNILYQCYGNYQSEEAFIHKSLLAIESITRLVSLGTAGMLNEENVLFLQKAAEFIKYSRVGLKAAEFSIEAVRGGALDNAHVLAKARDNFSTVAEMALREYAHSLKPIKLFNTNIQLPAGDLAILALNKGYSADLLLQNLVFGMLHAAKQEGLVTAEVSLYADTAIQGVLKIGHWNDLYQLYEEGKLSKHTLANEAINSILFILGNPILRDKLVAKSVEPEKTPAELSEITVEPPQSEEPKPAQECEPELKIASEDSNELKPEQASEPKIIPEETEEQKTLKALYEQKYTLEEELKNAKTQEARDEVNAKIDAFIKNTIERFKQIIPERALVDINIDPLKFVEEALNKDPQENKEKQLGYDLLQSSLIEIQKAFQGEYAAHGYLGAFADAFHNDSFINNNGNTDIYVRHVGTNTGQIHATGSIGVFGQDAYNKTLENKIINKKLTHLVNSQFQNFESGTISAEEIILSYCVGLLDNFGVINSYQNVRVVASRILENHETGKVIATKDVNLLCDLLAQNKGLMSGENVTLEGTEEGAINSGTIYGLDKIRLISKKLASNEETGALIAPRVAFESQNINKEGVINSIVVDTLGYDEARPSSTTWKKQDDDSIGALLLKSNASDNIEADAFSRISLVDVTLDAPFKDKLLFNVSPDFSNILQLHFPEADTIIPIGILPQLSNEATLVLDAPGHDLDATETSTYNSHFRFTGNNVLYSGGNTNFSETAFFAVNKMVGHGGETKFYIEKGGFIQAEQMLNKGLFHSDGILTWNLKKIDNDAELEHYTQYLYKNKKEKDNNQLTPCESTRVVEDSGVIYAVGHRGHLGEFNQHGGVFLSGEEGNFVYHAGGHQRAILTHEARQTADVIEDGGINYYTMPTYHNAEMNSTGQNTLMGKEKILASGFDFEGDKGSFLYAGKDIEATTQSADYHIPATESRSRKGKFKKYVHQDERGNVITQNNISSKKGDVLILAPDGSVKLEKTIIDAGKNGIIVSKSKVDLNGVSNTTQSKDRKRHHSLLRSKTKKSETTETKIERSYIFTNENLTICCEELTLDATWASIKGDFHLIAKTAAFDGKEQTFDSKTTTKEYSFSMPALDNLQAILNGKNAKDIFKHLVSSFGWNGQELQKILHAKSVTELPGPAIRFARDTFNLTTFVAHACGELGNSPKDFIGAITDKLGLTVQLGDENKTRIPNPRFSFKMTKTTEQTHASQSIPTEIVVGGTFSMLGNTLYLRKGSKVDAEQLRIFLIEGIKATYGTEIFQFSRNSQSISLGMNALNPSDIDVGIGLSKQYKYDETHHNAKLNARDKAEIHALQSIEGNLQIEAESGEVAAAHMNFESTQNTHISKTFELNVSASTTGSSAGASMQKGKTEEYTTEELAGIKIKNGIVRADTVNLENGSEIIAKELHRADGKEGLPIITGSDAKDSKVEKSKGFGFQVQPNQGMSGNPSGGVNFVSEKQETLRRATVIADNVAEGDLPNVNTDASKQSEVITNKRKAVDLEGSKSEFDKLTEVGKQSIKSLQTLLNPAEPQVNPAESQENNSLSLDNPYVKKALESEYNNLFSEVSGLGKKPKEVPQLQNDKPIKLKDEEKKPKNLFFSKETEHNKSDKSLSLEKLNKSNPWSPIYQKIIGDSGSDLAGWQKSMKISSESSPSFDQNTITMNELRELFFNTNNLAEGTKQENIFRKVFNHINNELQNINQLFDPDLSRDRREAIYQNHPQLREYEDEYNAGIQRFNSMMPKSAAELAGDLALGAGALAIRPLLLEGKYLYVGYNIDKKGNVSHVFSTVRGKPKHGHLPDTLLNRREIAKTFLKEENFIGKDSFGKKWYAEIKSNNTQLWAYFKPNGQLSGGLNKEIVPWDPIYGLRKPPFK